ncbi:MAG: bifunctional phosphoribosyl-AMP cyclohydrolase/phosphoribosyl-ATP diphosphatase HisIE [Ornithinimicrobium sp.]
MSGTLPLTLVGGHGVEDLAFDKGGGLVPAVVQHAETGVVLMVGFCDEAAVRSTLLTGLATFYSRGRGRQWVKGESSGNTLTVVQAAVDCDADTLLLRCLPAGPTCHTGEVSCFSGADGAVGRFLPELDELVRERAAERPSGSYTTSLLDAGVRRMAQKVGEEGVETALAAVVENDDALLGESADLLFHLLVLLHSRGLGLSEVDQVLRSRHRA